MVNVKNRSTNHFLTNLFHHWLNKWFNCASLLVCFRTTKTPSNTSDCLLTKATWKASSTWVSCISGDSGCPGTRKRPSSTSTWPLRTDTRWLSTTWPRCKRVVWACSGTLRRRISRGVKSC